MLASRVAQGPKWTLGFFSNTGVTCSVIAEVFQNRAEALLSPNGLAGQWVVEFFMVRASRESRAASGRLWYRMRSILVTSDGFTLYRVTRDGSGIHDEIVGQLSVSGDGGQVLGW